jgi:hypothetical protein
LAGHGIGTSGCRGVGRNGRRALPTQQEQRGLPISLWNRRAILNWWIMALEILRSHILDFSLIESVKV